MGGMSEISAEEFMGLHRDPVLTALRCMVTVASCTRGGLPESERVNALVAEVQSRPAGVFISEHHQYLVGA